MGLLYKCVSSKSNNQAGTGVSPSTTVIMGQQPVASAPPVTQFPVNMQYIIQQDEEKGLRNIFKTSEK